jgi:hypothetical protein
LGKNGAKAIIGNINFGDSISGFFQKILENFFRHFLKDNGKEKTNCQAYVFDTGI